jgi:hypothetical protein
LENEKERGEDEEKICIILFIFLRTKEKK